MHCKPIILNPLINGTAYAKSMVDSGCSCYGLCDPAFATKTNLERIEIRPFYMEAFDGAKAKEPIREVVVADVDLEGYTERIWMYVTPLGGYDMYLGMPWIKKRNVRIDQRGSRIRIGPRDDTLVVRTAATFQQDTAHLTTGRLVSAAAWTMIRRREGGKAQVFAASLADINKALRGKTYTNPADKLPSFLHKHLSTFDRKAADTLPPLRGSNTDHRIELEKTADGKEPEVPWGPLYSMSKDELLVLRKTLNELLDKSFIRVSNSPAAAPVLFVKKPGGGLRFCVDYRALNSITRKDRYPLPLIQETLRSLSEAVIYTKLDVIAAFHRLRIAEGDEWKTAFRTRFGSYEWMVTPFGLANAPSTFQRYINWVLRDLLDDYCSAYIDDIIIYSKDRSQHRKHVEEVLTRLHAAGLQCDIDKCEFEVESTKYLGFIIEAGKGVRMDPDKVKAIQEWETPTTVKGVRGFLGFANFYRKFIDHYSDIVRPLTELTHKDKVFSWNDEAEAAFCKLKRVFLSEPTLARFDYDKPTRVETDSSGWCIGGAMLQPNDEGLYVPCSFFSKKLDKTECNYEIYDKEMLAIVRSLEEWDAELRSLKEFVVHSDHKNLEYFMTVRKLTERQMRWSLTLSRFNFRIVHVPGVDNGMADALSRRDQDMPANADDVRLKERQVQLIKPEWIVKGQLVVSSSRPRITPVRDTIRSQDQGEHDLFSQPGLENTPELSEPYDLTGSIPTLIREWPEAVRNDSEYCQIRETIEKKEIRFPPTLRLKVSITECGISPSGKLTFRDRIWVPSTSNIRTRILQEIHDSTTHVHPGREALYAIAARQFFWPGMSRDVRTFVENCTECGSNKAWRGLRQGFLKPLPIPHRIWSEISMDFITKLPLSEGCSNIVVVTDRLSKGVIADGLEDLETETVTKWFLRRYYPHHFLPNAIVSDRGAQFTGALWKRICDTLQIRRRLSTAFSPETDGSTERANEVVETVLRQLVNWAQTNWMDWLQIGVSAICGRNASSTGVAPFFMSHGWNQDVFNFETPPITHRQSPVAQADTILAKLKEVREWAETSIATAQELQEKASNRKRTQSPQYKVNDKVWLNLENIKTDRPSKKLDQRHALYTILEVMGSHTYRLNTPPGIHNVFHTKLLRPVTSEPLPGQVVHETQPPGLEVNNQVEYDVEEIVNQKKSRGGADKYLVKWVGYKKPTWEPWDFVQDLTAMDNWNNRIREGYVPEGLQIKTKNKKKGR
jgi:transposase InsO family protein